MEERIFTTLSKIFERFPVEQEKLISSSKSLALAPSETVIRINTLLATPEDAIDNLKSLIKAEESYDFNITQNSEFRYVLHVPAKGPFCVEVKSRRVIVSKDCARAVLRGAPVFAPGVVAIEDGTDSEVSIWADCDGRCTQGLKQRYNGDIFFVGNGLLVMVMLTF